MSEKTENVEVTGEVAAQQYEEGEDTLADALAALALIGVFVFTCIYWISGQS